MFFAGRRGRGSPNRVKRGLGVPVDVAPYNYRVYVCEKSYVYLSSRHGKAVPPFHQERAHIRTPLETDEVVSEGILILTSVLRYIDIIYIKK